jgi:hypothetical protein
MLSHLIVSLFERKLLLANALLSVAVAVLYSGETVAREWLFFILAGSGWAGTSDLGEWSLRRTFRRGVLMPLYSL